jgi:hypothetical protein
MATFGADLAFGEQSEREQFSTIETFLGHKLNHKGGKSIFDFDNGANVFCDLKTRRIPHDRYSTAIIGANKVMAARMNPQNTYWFIYKYSDGIFGIQYSKEKFDTFEHSDYSRGDREDYHNNAQHCYFIPHKELQRIQ